MTLTEQLIQKGLRQGIEQGMQQGLAAAKAADALDVLDARGLVVTDAQREQILACKDLEMLTHWLRRAVTVATTAELFA